MSERGIGTSGKLGHIIQGTQQCTDHVVEVGVALCAEFVYACHNLTKCSLHPHNGTIRIGLSQTTQALAVLKKFFPIELDPDAIGNASLRILRTDKQRGKL